MICNDEDTDGRARVTTDEERVKLKQTKSTRLVTSGTNDSDKYKPPLNIISLE